MDKLDIPSGCKVLLLWSGSNSPEAVKDAVNVLTQKTGAGGRVQVEHVERLHLSQHSSSSFNTVVSGYIPPCSTVHTSPLLAEVARILKPGGAIYVREPATRDSQHQQLRPVDKLSSVLKLSGFVNTSQPTEIPLSTDEENELKELFGNDSNVAVVETKANKPNYEVGASSQLKISFAKPVAPAPVQDVNAAAVWALSANDMLDDDLDIIDDDELLDEGDLKKPDPESLRVSCSDAPQKKKACKNCTCGLAEELETEVKGNTKTVKTAATSSCGNCYLGDAFRCASCPYLGMPAFKPGEKITLSNRQLNPDK